LTKSTLLLSGDDIKAQLTMDGLKMKQEQPDLHIHHVHQITLQKQMRRQYRHLIKNLELSKGILALEDSFKAQNIEQPSKS